MKNPSATTTPSRTTAGIPSTTPVTTPTRPLTVSNGPLARPSTSTAKLQVPPATESSGKTSLADSARGPPRGRLTPSKDSARRPEDEEAERRRIESIIFRKKPSGPTKSQSSLGSTARTTGTRVIVQKICAVGESSRSSAAGPTRTGENRRVAETSSSSIPGNKGQLEPGKLNLKKPVAPTKESKSTPGAISSPHKQATPAKEPTPRPPPAAAANVASTPEGVEVEEFTERVETLNEEICKVAGRIARGYHFPYVQEDCGTCRDPPKKRAIDPEMRREIAPYVDDTVLDRVLSNCKRSAAVKIALQAILAAHACLVVSGCDIRTDAQYEGKLAKMLDRIFQSDPEKRNVGFVTSAQQEIATTLRFLTPPIDVLAEQVTSLSDTVIDLAGGEKRREVSETKVFTDIKNMFTVAETIRRLCRSQDEVPSKFHVYFPYPGTPFSADSMAVEDDDADEKAQILCGVGIGLKHRKGDCSVVVCAPASVALPRKPAKDTGVREY